MTRQSICVQNFRSRKNEMESWDVAQSFARSLICRTLWCAVGPPLFHSPHQSWSSPGPGVGWSVPCDPSRSSSVWAPQSAPHPPPHTSQPSCFHGVIEVPCPLHPSFNLLTWLWFTWGPIYNPDSKLIGLRRDQGLKFPPDAGICGPHFFKGCNLSRPDFVGLKMQGDYSDECIRMNEVKREPGK